LFQREQWTDLDDFSLRLTDELFDTAMAAGIKPEVVGKVVHRIRTNFFSANKMSKAQFAKKLQARVSDFEVIMHEISLPLTTTDLFPEISKVQDSQVDEYLPLDVEERYLQDSLRRVLRAKRGTPISDRNKDTAQEVADIEHFRIEVKEKGVSLAVVVKGYRSVSHKTITWQDVSHQVTKAYQRTKPDYILLAIAKDPTDGVITSLKEYGQTTGKPDLVIVLPPRDFVRLLLSNRLLPLK